jgi:lysozyme
MTFDRTAMLAELTRDEGLRHTPYRDSVGKLTIGIGRNLDDRGISAAEAHVLALNDIAIAEADLDRHCPWWRQMSDARQRALLNMCFNMGWGNGRRGLSTFANTLRMLEEGRYGEAANNALRSKWAEQVGARARRIAQQFREG